MRDYLLRKYLIRCKLYHSLAFFRWRAAYAECESEDKKEERQHELREIFENKVSFMKEHLEKAVAYRKTITA